MAEYIDREALYKEVTEKYKDIVAGKYPFNIVAYDMAQMVKNAPKADVAEVKHGEWKEIEIFDGDMLYQCSACGIEWCFIDGTPSENGTKYCPNCGAKMDGGEK